MLFKRLLFRKLKFVTHIKILKSDDICSRSVLRYSVVTSVCNDISYVVISFRQLIVNTIESFAVVVFGKISDIFKKNDLRLFFIGNSHYFKKQIATLICKAFFCFSKQKTTDKEILRQKYQNREYLLH